MTQPTSKVVAFIEQIGSSVIGFFESLGAMILFFINVLKLSLRPPFRMTRILKEMEFVGADSLFIIVLTGTFTGIVFSYNSADKFAMFNAETLVGPVVAIALTRELAPVLAGLMLSGRVGSAMATELGTMRVTEQIEAMEAMAVNPVQYLIVPKLIAMFCMMPLLTTLFNLLGIGGSYLVSVVLLDLDSGIFIHKVSELLVPFDIVLSVIKAAVFGVSITIISCFNGFNATGGARGVGIATTNAVVSSMVSIFILDFLLTLVLL